MSHYLISAILGVVEGVTEFLPVSSTAHLRLCESWLGISLTDEYWKMFSIVIQLGAILSVVVYFRERIAHFLRRDRQAAGNFSNAATACPPFEAICNKLSNKLAVIIPFDSLFLKTMLAFVLTAGPSLLLVKVIGHNLESLRVMGWSLFIGGVIMIAVDVYFRHPVQDVDQMTWTQAAGVGIAQIFSAVFPGTSRSMSTIAGGEILGMSRASALEFSFLLSIPTMIAATVYDLLKTWHNYGGRVLGTSEQWILLAIGFVISFFVAWAVVAWFMSWVRKHGFVPFGVYRIALGIFVLFCIRH